jgi:hypothetical protein
MEQQASPPHVRAEARATARFVFEVTLDVPPRDAIELFTPDGERKWADGWEPLYVNTPDVRRVGAGTVFTTDDHAVSRIWIVDAYDRDAGVVGYTVFTSEENVTRIAIRVSSRAGGSVARVSYDRTSLNANADANVELFARHAHLMQAQWQRALDALHRH